MSSRVVVITGAGAGIGRALAKGFASDGFTVVGLGRTPESLNETGAGCAPGRFLPIVADVSEHAVVDRAIQSVLTSHGPIDALVCNAAVYPRVHFLDQPAEDWERALLINVCGVANCCRSVLPGMLERNHGRIVVVGSFADLNPIPASSAYAASKGAIHALVRALSSEIDRTYYPDVLINEFNPGVTQTSMSSYGDPPEAACPRVKKLVDFPSGGPTGRLFVQDREVVLNESLKRRLLRMVGLGRRR